MEIKKAVFKTSVSDYRQYGGGGSPEIAIAGKSNVGKSSFINMMTGHKGLAKTSSTPGRTRLLNFFEINDGQFTFVDLPGYGFARAPEAEKQKWGKLAEDYFLANPYLINVFILQDIRREVSPLDKQMAAFLHHYGIPFTVIATKCDKLSRSAVARQKQLIASGLAIGADNVIATSAQEGTGKKEVCARIADLLAARSLGSF